MGVWDAQRGSITWSLVCGQDHRTRALDQTLPDHLSAEADGSSFNMSYFFLCQVKYWQTLGFRFKGNWMYCSESTSGTHQLSM